MPAVLVAGPHYYAELPQQWRKPSPVLTAPTHRGMARLSGPRWPPYQDSRPASRFHGLTTIHNAGGGSDPKYHQFAHFFNEFRRIFHFLLAILYCCARFVVNQLPRLIELGRNCRRSDAQRAQPYTTTASDNVTVQPQNDGCVTWTLVGWDLMALSAQWGYIVMLLCTWSYNLMALYKSVYYYYYYYCVQ